MQTFQQIIPLLLTLSLAGLVVSVGLNATHRDLLYVLTRPKLLAKAILAVDVIPPVAAAGLAALLPIEPAVKTGIVLMAISPVPPLVPGQGLGVGARREYAYGVYLAMALLTLVTAPTAVSVLDLMLDQRHAVDMADIVKTVVLGVLIPLSIGLAIRAVAYGLAAKLAPWVYGLSMLLVLVAFVPIAVTIWPQIQEDILGNGALAAMTAVTVIALAGGHVLGGPDRIDSGALAIASAVRHPGIAIILARANDTDPQVVAAILLYMLTGLTIGIPYKQWLKRTTRRPADAQPTP